MAHRAIGYGKLSIKALDPDNDEFTENLAYVRSNLAGDSSTAESEAASIAGAVHALIENLTDNKSSIDNWLCDRNYRLRVHVRKWRCRHFRCSRRHINTSLLCNIRSMLFVMHIV